MNIILEKYIIDKILHSSSNGKVYLVTHMRLGVKRVIKEITRDSMYSDNFYMEINILKNIRHDNIPIIYDVEEYADKCYIVEEYIEGQSLFDMIELKGSIDESSAIDYGYQIASLIAFLHSNESNPILFLDLQPRNIIVNNDKIYIVDFGSSMIKNILERNKVFGTLGFAAPEQYNGEELGPDTDIYGIGALLFYMVTAANPKKGMDILISSDSISRKLKRIILICLKENRKHRYSDAKTLLQKLDLLKNVSELRARNMCSEEEPLYVSVVGTEMKVGTTYIAFQMAMYLNKLGVDVVYKENNNSKHMNSFVQMHNEYEFKGGMYIYENLKIIPHYEKCVEISSASKVVVIDEGVYDCDKKYSKVLFLVSGSSEWEIQNTKHILEKHHSFISIIFNQCEEEKKEIIKKNIIESDNFYYMPSRNGMIKQIDFSFYKELLQEVIGLQSSDEETRCDNKSYFVSVIDKIKKYKEEKIEKFIKNSNNKKEYAKLYKDKNRVDKGCHNICGHNKRKGVTIGIMGASSAIGCTTVAVSFSMYLRHVLGAKVAVIENNSRKCFRKMALLKESVGISHNSHIYEEVSFYYNNMNTYISDDEILFDNGEYNYVINDYGEYTESAFREMEKCEYKIIILSMQSWKIQDAESVIQKLGKRANKNSLRNTTIVINGTERDKKCICENTDVSVKSVPHISDATKLNDEIIDFYKDIIH